MHFKRSLDRLAGGFLFALCAAALLAAMIALHGCAKEGDTQLALPSIASAQAVTPETAAGSLVQCRPFHGHGPTKWIHVPEDGTKLNLCFSCGVCFYGCPRE